MSNADFSLAESVLTTNASYFVFVYILVLIYCCFGLAVVCDVYFVPALQKLSTNIAGSTLMALGASVPELFASLIGVFVTEDDIGTGSIIGSSSFNLIAVPAACAFVASCTFSHPLIISPKPVLRNSAFYAITILVLLLIIKDNKVDMLESSVLLLFFFMYMGFMIFSASQSKKDCYDSSRTSFTSSYISTDSAIAECSQKGAYYGNSNSSSNKNRDQMQQVYGQFYLNLEQSAAHDPILINSNNNHNHNRSNNQQQQAAPRADEKTPLVSSQGNKLYTQIIMPQQSNLEPSICEYQFGQPANDAKLESVGQRLNLGIAMKNSTCLVSSGDLNRFGLTRADADEIANSKLKLVDNPGTCNGSIDDDEHHDNWVSSNWILVPLFPLTLGMKVLTPCKFKNTCWTIWTFFISIALIGGLTYISIWMVHLFGQTLGVPETVSGMTILSWGTGIPELIASIVLIKKTAQADMAICNTIGSNVIDISFCLSLPWIVKCLIFKTQGLKPHVEIQSEALPWTTFSLLVSVLALILVLKLHGWVLSYSVGVWLTIVYSVFVALAIYLEYNFAESGLDLLSLF